LAAKYPASYLRYIIIDASKKREKEEIRDFPEKNLFKNEKFY